MNRYINALFRNILRNLRNKLNLIIIQVNNKYSAGPIYIGNRVVIPNRQGLKLGEKVRIGDEVKILIESCRNKIQSPKAYIGNNVKIGDRIVLSVYKNEVINIADGVSIQSGSVIIGNVEIGKDTLLSSNIYLSSRNHNFDKTIFLSIREQDKIYGQSTNSKVKIGEDCWLGWGVVIRPGIEIGKGSIVGSNAVVTKSIPPYEIWGGIPAKFIRKRFSIQ